MYNQAAVADNVFHVTPKAFHYYINHSCDPNASDIARSPNYTHYVAVRHINAQEEITADYYDATTLAMCACKSPRCRWTSPGE
jgi:SET domain-containing protein